MQAQQAPPPPPPPLQPGIPGPLHFWEEGTITFRKIKGLNADIEKNPPGPMASQERPTVNLWLEICRLYFPSTNINPTGPVWATEAEPDRGPVVHPKRDIVDVVTVKYDYGNAMQQLKRDYLWIECKRASHDTPHGWKDVLEEAGRRLSGEPDAPNKPWTPAPPMWLIIAIGSGFMIFYWDPYNTIQQPQLFIRSAGVPGGGWMINDKIKAIMLNTDFVNVTTGEIFPKGQWKLDTTLEPIYVNGIGWQYRYKYGKGMGMLEQHLIAISNSVLPGNNPDHWA